MSSKSLDINAYESSFQEALVTILSILKWDKFSASQTTVLHVLLVEKKPIILGAATNWGKSSLYKVPFD